MLFANRHRRIVCYFCGTGEIPARLHLEIPLNVQRGYNLRRSTASACQGHRYAADKAGVGTDLDRTAHLYPNQEGGLIHGIVPT